MRIFQIGCVQITQMFDKKTLSFKLGNRECLVTDLDQIKIQELTFSETFDARKLQ